MSGEVSPSHGDEVTPHSELRASHEDRDRAVEILRVAAGDGRLSAEELDERLEAALTARTYGELAVLTRDLPAVPGASAVAAAAAPKDLVRIACASGSASRDGSWVVPKRMEVQVTSGNVRLDFTEAVFTQPLLQIAAEVRSGSLTLVTRPGIEVDTGEVSVRSGTAKVRAHTGPPVPVALRVEVSGSVGSGSIKARPPRRTFWQWLLRRPVVYSR
ncbi:MAG TPA: DUF1707 domain-containing protein [Streptosporangiaceae bacterium]|nr:DUF1707 domain-containing protein [Streptosporangiaceae bacterium]